VCSALNPLLPSDDAREQKKNIFEDLFSSVFLQFKRYHPSGNVKFIDLDIFLKISYFNRKTPHFSQAKFHFKYFGVLWVNFKGFIFIVLFFIF